MNFYKVILPLLIIKIVYVPKREILILLKRVPTFLPKKSLLQNSYSASSIQKNVYGQKKNNSIFMD